MSAVRGLSASVSSCQVQKAETSLVGDHFQWLQEILLLQRISKCAHCKTATSHIKVSRCHRKILTTRHSTSTTSIVEVPLQGLG